MARNNPFENPNMLMGVNPDNVEGMMQLALIKAAQTAAQVDQSTAAKFLLKLKNTSADVVQKVARGEYDIIQETVTASLTTSGVNTGSFFAGANGQKFTLSGSYPTMIYAFLLEESAAELSAAPFAPLPNFTANAKDITIITSLQTAQMSTTPNNKFNGTTYNANNALGYYTLNPFLVPANYTFGAVWRSTSSMPNPSSLRITFEYLTLQAVPSK